jgi:hypothetical protein
MPSAEIEPAGPEVKRFQTYALDRTATGNGSTKVYLLLKNYPSSYKMATCPDPSSFITRQMKMFTKRLAVQSYFAIQYTEMSFLK